MVANNHTSTLLVSIPTDRESGTLILLWTDVLGMPTIQMHVVISIPIDSKLMKCAVPAVVVLNLPTEALEANKKSINFR